MRTSSRWLRASAARSASAPVRTRTTRSATGATRGRARRRDQALRARAAVGVRVPEASGVRGRPAEDADRKDPAHRAARARARGMIARVWRGRTAAADAPVYEHHFRDDVLPELARVDGFSGATLLRRVIDGMVEFMTITRFDSLDSVR